MGYVAKQLSEGERIVHASTGHPVVFAGPAALALASLALFFVEAGAAAAGVGLVLAALWFLAAWLAFRFTELAVTDRRVIVRVGLLSRRTVVEPLTELAEVAVTQSMAGRALRYGSVELVGEGRRDGPFHRVRRPALFRQHVLDGIAAAHARAAEKHLRALRGGDAASGSGDGALARLERLAELRREGALSEEEFEEQKRKLLSD